MGSSCRQVANTHLVSAVCFGPLRSLAPLQHSHARRLVGGQVATSPPQLRSIVAYAALSKDPATPEHNRETVVELVGARVRCASGVRVMYGYAEYRRYGARLTTAQRETQLWLLNMLNKAELAELRWYCCHSFIEAARRNPAMSRASGGRGGGGHGSGRSSRRRSRDRGLLDMQAIF